MWKTNLFVAINGIIRMYKIDHLRMYKFKV